MTAQVSSVLDYYVYTAAASAISGSLPQPETEEAQALPAATAATQPQNLPLFQAHEPHAQGILSAFKDAVRVTPATRVGWELFVRSLVDVDARIEFARGFFVGVPTGAEKWFNDWQTTFTTLKLAGNVITDLRVLAVFVSGGLDVIVGDVAGARERIAATRKPLVDFIAIAHPSAYEKFENLPERFAALQSLIEKVAAAGPGDLVLDLARAAGIAVRQAMENFLMLNGRPAEQGAVVGALAGEVLMELVTDLLFPLPFP
jgi:hypothetical protein